MTDIEQNAENPNYLIVIVGMKCDLVDEKEVTIKEAMKFAKNCGAHYFETSAKEGTMVKEMF